ncbi:LLM class flavin-dependent oxidoreductase [Siccirubricoccus sp. KC 17139]|uniref:LLM class flavin-dependent oxidoreductase n=1 Tax=Siccirubricoccus soli TaxID=2899147 RepID=A0ABT1D9V7_9PROT|nr:LLM class flavin-dependent oxidoreductase [Siccirubricoccus soli]MCO6417974.1 LLM class flavin-dependent oxidoreductase [Siccirubricoccus soli]MCP2684109.1 LLM class flavin-dependent oxidoreductase [Siccirubricoccus soli]
MDAWWQCEIPYPYVDKRITDAADSVRASLPNRLCDPRIAANLFHEVLDEFALCDELGMNVLCIEHHAGINSLIGSNPMITGILARQTRNVRVLSLGTLISLRPDPVRVAEEYATADCLLRGRFEIGFVKSGGTEVASSNMQPVNNEERFWEAIDLIKKTLTSHDGPFSWEGKHYTHRHVNIWPGPYQQPHPRMWAATGDPRSAAEVGRRGMTHVLVLRGPEGTKKAYEAHRTARREAGLPKVTTDNFAYAAMVYVGETEEEGIEGGTKLLWFLNTSLKSAPQYNKFLPGAAPPQAAPGLYRTMPRAEAGLALTDAEKGVAPASQNAQKLMGLTAQEAMQQGILFAGTPDSVHRQIMEFYDKVGGFGHLCLIGRSGYMTHEESKKGIRLFSKEVLPRLREVAPVEVG